MEYPETSVFQLRNWAEDDRPREKLLLKGVRSLSNVELLALLIGSGTQKNNAVEVARKLLNSADNDLNELGNLSISQLKKVQGIGSVKAITITGALELGRRRKEVKAKNKLRFICSMDLFDFMLSDMMDLPNEQFWIILLDRKNQLIKKQCVTTGGVSETIVDLRLIFKIAVEELASHIVLIHNHPSGDFNPSQNDISLTRQLIKAGHIMDIPILDHIIISNRGYYSFKDEKKVVF
ncbi:MAG: hypothetical protein A3H98_01805 [Bacteroidetes bacterium RIFCSPLOWO2_02_FULL_36_8]|nr:MAG: hypothetical protein A3H98_01805 [Bacteroidetes bacterium RIFCSPLOWO2_02_FULL_36_8]OFY69984.1 MAG: hypothetical protein A3G23_05645 [Bacteroidetes bacterium RIFCSPLOWO2_12_FULL_37_12]